MDLEALVALKGKTGFFTPYKESPQRFPVVILDVKKGGWGRDLVKHTPVGGTGEVWVEVRKVDFPAEAIVAAQ